MKQSRLARSVGMSETLAIDEKVRALEPSGGPGGRLGADANYYPRRSEIDGRRDYEGLRVFGSVTYGIRQ